MRISPNSQNVTVSLAELHDFHSRDDYGWQNTVFRLWRSSLEKCDTECEIFDGNCCDPAAAISAYWSSSSINVSHLSESPSIRPHCFLPALAIQNFWFESLYIYKCYLFWYLRFKLKSLMEDSLTKWPCQCDKFLISFVVHVYMYMYALCTVYTQYIFYFMY